MTHKAIFLVFLVFALLAVVVVAAPTDIYHNERKSVRFENPRNYHPPYYVTISFSESSSGSYSYTPPDRICPHAWVQVITLDSMRLSGCRGGASASIGPDLFGRTISASAGCGGGSDCSGSTFDSPPASFSLHIGGTWTGKLVCTQFPCWGSWEVDTEAKVGVGACNSNGGQSPKTTVIV